MGLGKNPMMGEMKYSNFRNIITDQYQNLSTYFNIFLIYFVAKFAGWWISILLYIFSRRGSRQAGPARTRTPKQPVTLPARIARKCVDSFGGKWAVPFFWVGAKNIHPPPKAVIQCGPVHCIIDCDRCFKLTCHWVNIYIYIALFFQSSVAKYYF